MKKKRKLSEIASFSLVILLFVILFLGKQHSITGFTIFSLDPANGTFNNTYFDGESVKLNLSGNFSEGTYISQIIEFEENTSLNNLTWNSSQCFNKITIIINQTIDNEKTTKNKKIKEIEYIVLYENKIASNLTFFIKDCEDSNCENKNWTFVDDPTQINLVNKYFQYKFKFETENLSCSPKLYSIEINYEILNNTLNLSEPIEEPPANENTGSEENTIIEVVKEEKEADQIEEIKDEQEEVKEDTLELQQAQPEENQNLITGFVAFTKNNVLIFNGFTLLLAMFILLYIFVIRRRNFRMGQNFKKASKK